MQHRQHTETILARKRQRLWKLEERQATYGLETPVHIELEIDQLRVEVAELERTLAKPAPLARAYQELVPPDRRPALHPGLIVIIGPGRERASPLDPVALAAIEYHRGSKSATLRHCWLLASGGERGSLDVATQLKQRCAEYGIAAAVWLVDDAFSVQETYDLVQWLFANEVPPSGLADRDVICDFTGGTKPMSAGMILACGAQRAMQYMTLSGQAPNLVAVPLLVQFAARSDSG
ncbi:MAG: hypothetical protein H7Y32_01865 [Chloroflexales bacterium]|nr:hypothetical protein [Chloroflexales bacterium]